MIATSLLTLLPYFLLFAFTVCMPLAFVLFLEVIPTFLMNREVKSIEAKRKLIEEETLPSIEHDPLAQQINDLHPLDSQLRDLDKALNQLNRSLLPEKPQGFKAIILRSTL